MIEKGRARLVEYNARFGDPECQVLMMRLGGQALDLPACAEGKLSEARDRLGRGPCLDRRHGGQGLSGRLSEGLGHPWKLGVCAVFSDSRHMVFHAGTVEKEGQILAQWRAGPNVTARELGEARNRAYAMIDHISWPEGFCRSDIGWRALKD